MRKVILLYIFLITSVHNLSSQSNLLDTTEAHQLQNTYRLNRMITDFDDRFCEINHNNFPVFYDLDCDTIVYLKDSLLIEWGANIICHPHNSKSEKKYNIPDSIFLSSYPFNADSIVIVQGSNYCNEGYKYLEIQHELLQEYGINNYRIIKKMSTDEIVEFADNLYNYDFLDYNPIRQPYSSVTVDNPPIYNYSWAGKLGQVITGSDTYLFTNNNTHTPPNIILLFYHNKTINYVGLYFDSDYQIRIATSFLSKGKGEPFFGNFCFDRNIRLRSFFQSNYNLNIVGCREKNIIEIKELKERK